MRLEEWMPCDTKLVICFCVLGKVRGGGVP